MSHVMPETLAERTNGRTLLDVFADTVVGHSDGVALRERGHDGWREITWAEYAHQAACLATGLREFGVTRGTSVCLLMRNRIEHYLADVACLLVGAVPTSLYLTSSPEQIRWLLTHSGATVVIVDGPVEIDRVLGVRADVPALEHVVTVTADAPDGVVPLADLLERPPLSWDVARAEAAPDHVATTIYTSGTTGSPKAAEHTHASLVAMAESSVLLFGEQFSGRRLISYMPFAHIAERLNSHYTGMRAAHVVSCCPEITELAQYVPEVRPQFLFGPPRIWDKLSAAMAFIAEYAPAEADKAAYRRALDVGDAVVVARRSDPDTPLPVELAAQWDEAEPARRALRAAIGLGDLEIAVTAAATLPDHVMDRLEAVGIVLSDMYGMTEFGTGTGDPYAPRRGTLGRAFPGTELRVAPDGEIELRGPASFRGYRDDPEATAAVFTDDGWLRSGDLGRLGADGYLELIGRKKDLIITAGGKNIAPAPLENAIASHPLVGVAVVVGEARKFPAALITLDPMAAEEWAKRNQLDGASIEQLATEPAVIAELQRHVGEINERVARVEQIKRFAVLSQAWGPDSEELTPTMKVRRSVVTAKYRDDIDKLYV